MRMRSNTPWKNVHFWLLKVMASSAEKKNCSVFATAEFDRFCDSERRGDTAPSGRRGIDSCGRHPSEIDRWRRHRSRVVHTRTHGRTRVNTAYLVHERWAGVAYQRGRWAGLPSRTLCVRVFWFSSAHHTLSGPAQTRRLSTFIGRKFHLNYHVTLVILSGY